MAKKPPKGKSLAEVNPELAKQWHESKNGDLTPFDFTNKSGAKVWWQCPKGDDHEWEAKIYGRSNGNNCAVCRGYKVVKSNCLATTHPDIAEQWHPTKNGNLTPNDVVAGTRTKVWWQCTKGDDHEWQSIVANRINGSGCNVCNNKIIVKSNCLETTHPNLAKEWHPSKNGELTPLNTGSGSNKKIWWKCSKGDDHEWKVDPNSRVGYKTNCPICEGLKVVKSNCLTTTHPDIAEQWHPTKNGNLTPNDVVAGSEKRVWWKCFKADDHEWSTQVDVKVRTICPMCSNKRIVKSNCLATTHPDIAEQWHPTKNGNLTPNDVVAGTRANVWWKCLKGYDHEWKSNILDLSRGKSHCPFCTLTPQSKQELTITFELIKFFKEINPKGFKTRVKGKLWSIDIYIPQLKLGIEFDGSYWHKDKRALDKLKTENLEEEGFEIFRVREEPLKRIFDDDIMSKKPFNAKQVANDILTQIMSRYSLNTKKIAKIESYIAKKELQNEKGLDKYIDMILTEKAEKKK